MTTPTEEPRREAIDVEEHERTRAPTDTQITVSPRDRPAHVWPTRSTATVTLPAGTVTLRPAHEMPKRRSPPNRHERRRMAALARRRMRR